MVILDPRFSAIRDCFSFPIGELTIPEFSLVTLSFDIMNGIGFYRINSHSNNGN